jgi:hypothetical protein
VFLVLAVPATVMLNLLSATGAHALPRQICTLQEVITYSPPLTNTAQTVTYTVHGELTNCTDSSAPSGSYEESGTAAGASCNSILASAGGSRTFRWESGDQSVFQYKVRGRDGHIQWRRTAARPARLRNRWGFAAHGGRNPHDRHLTDR